MARIKVVADSACDLPEEIVQRLDVAIVSLTIRFGEEEFVDRVDLDPTQFWTRCKASKVLPETAAPSPGAFQATFERAAEEGYDGVVVLTLSAALSATHQSASLAAEAVAGRIPVSVVDTQAVSGAEGLLVIEVAERAQGGADLDDLVAYAESLKSRLGIVAMLDTLEHLIKGGRVGGARALLGQVLSIKPIVALKDGVVAEAGRQRTRARALASIAETARREAPLARLAVVHGDVADVADFARSVADIEVAHPLVVSDIGPVVGTHAGPGVIGLCWLKA